jgi:tetratricopeptide (TPR) repeat protein
VSRPEAAQLNDQIVARVTELCELGDEDVEHQRFDAAIARYEEALGLVPRPLYSWAVTTWILTAMAEAYHLMKDPARVKETLMEAFRCEGAIGNPFLHLRLGQAEIALGAKGRGVEELIRAHERGGDEVFDGEEPRYLAMVKAALDAG